MDDLYFSLAVSVSMTALAMLFLVVLFAYIICHLFEDAHYEALAVSMSKYTARSFVGKLTYLYWIMFSISRMVMVAVALLGIYISIHQLYIFVRLAQMFWTMV